MADRTVTLTSDELEALRDWFPRVTVVTYVPEGSAIHSALLKLLPEVLPNALKCPQQSP